MALKSDDAKMLLAFWILFIFCSSSCEGTSRNYNQVYLLKKYEQWIVQHGRVYQNEVEKNNRFQTFVKNLQYIEAVNNAGNRSYKLGLNEFSDLTNQEFRDLHMGYKTSLPMTSHQPRTAFRYQTVKAVPASLDWTTKGAVTDVKNQESCGNQIFLKIFVKIEKSFK